MDLEPPAIGVGDVDAARPARLDDLGGMSCGAQACGQLVEVLGGLESESHLERFAESDAGRARAETARRRAVQPYRPGPEGPSQRAEPRTIASVPGIRGVTGVGDVRGVRPLGGVGDEAEGPRPRRVRLEVCTGEHGRHRQPRIRAARIVALAAVEVALALVEGDPPHEGRVMTPWRP